MATTRNTRVKKGSALLAACALVGTAIGAVALPQLAQAAPGPPTFSKVFVPDTIGPGSVSTLIFTIDNSAEMLVADNLDFTDPLPAGVTVAAGPNATTTCADSSGGPLTLSAPAGGGTISLTDAGVGAGASCTVSVDVTSSTPGTHMNTSGALTSSLGSSGTAAADLIVDLGRPGFSKDFTPDPIDKGERSTLTFLIDNTANPSDVTFASFDDTLPTGLVIADPADASTDCGSFFPPTVSAVPGTAEISFEAFGITTDGFEVVPTGATCSLVVDVVAVAAGTLLNTSSDLLVDSGALDNDSAGKATASLVVTRSDLHLTKEFTDDPVPPGGTATLEFTIENFDRNFPATAVAFSDTLPAGVVVFDPAPPNTTNTCGGTLVAVDATPLIDFSGGSIPAEGFCTITVPVTAAATGSYDNTSGGVTGTVNGSTVEGNAASDTLFVVPAPQLTKEFTDDPVGGGDVVTVEFTITNTSPVSAATDIDFFDDFPVVITSSPSGPPANGFCGGTSTATFTNRFVPVGAGATTPARLTVSNAELAPAGTPGDSCTFFITVDVAAGTPSGLYTNTTSEVTATVSAMTVTGRPASDDLEVIAGPFLDKEFTDDPIEPGDTVTLEFTLTNDNPTMPPAATDFTATGIGFTDDLAATVAGLTATGMPLTEACDPDGAGGAPGTGTLSSSAGDTLLTFTGGELAPGESCTFSATLATTTATPQGVHENTTSNVTATVAGITTTELPGVDDLTVVDLDFTKSFTNDPVFPGDTVTLEFTIDNTSPTGDASSISFSDDFEDTLDTTPSAAGGSLALTAAEAATLPRPECGGTLFGFGGGTSVTFISGSLPQGSPPCTITLELDVPAAADAGVYPNTTTGFGADFGSGFVPLPNAIDELIVDEAALGITKSFTDDPVEPGDTVNLKFTLSNPTISAPGTGLAFTDDLEATLTGLLATGVFPVTDACVPVGGGAGTGTLAITGTQTLDYSGGTLAAGAACEIEVTLTVPAGASAANYPNTTSTLTGTINGLPVVATAATDVLKVLEPASSADLSVSKTASPDPVTAGEDLTYTITVDNAGPADAANVVVTDVLPAGVTYVSDTGGCTEAPVGTLTCSFGIVPIVPGTISFDVTVTVDADTPAGTITNDVSVASNTSDPDLSNNEASTDTTVEIEADLAISKTDAPDPVLAGEELVYTITVNNLGPSDATSVTVTDLLPAEVTYVSDTGGCVQAPVGTLTCSFGTIVATGSTNFDITVDVESGTTAASIANVASVSSLVPDPIAGNDSAIALTTVETEADLSITKTDLPDPVNAGETLTYTITIDNAGPSDALGVVVTDTLPAGVTFERTSMYGLDRNGTLFAVDVSTGVGTPLGALIPGTEIECDPAGAPTDCYLQEPNGSFTISPFDRKSVTLTGPPVSDGASFTGLEYVATTLYGTSIDSGGGPSTFSTLDPVTGASTPIGPTGVGPISGLAYDTTSSVMYGIAGGRGPADLYTIDVTTGVATTVGNTGMQAGSLQFDIDGLLYAGGTGINAGEIWLIDPLTGVGTFVGASGLTSITGLTSVPEPCEVGPPGTVTCMLGSIPAGSSTSVDIVVAVDSSTPAGVITNSASVDADTTDPDTSDNTTTEDTDIETEADLRIGKIDATDPALAGTSVTYTLDVFNDGPSDATNVIVVDDVPAGLMFDFAGVTCTPGVPGPGQLTCDLGDISSGNAIFFDITFTIDSDTPAGTITNEATVSSDIFDPDTSDNTTTEDTDIETEADLRIGKIDATDPALAGTSVTYTLDVFNDGPSDATNVIVVDDVPAGLMFDFAGVTCTPGVPGPGQLTCDLGDISSGNAIFFDITFTIDSDTPAGTITNEATVSSDIFDPDTSDNTTTEDTDIETEADLRIGKIDATDPALAGTSVTYTLDVFNDGPSDATNVIVVDDVPAGLMFDFAGVTCTPGVPGPGQLTCDLGDISSGNAIFFDITFTIDSDTPAGTITNEATVSSDIFDPDTSDNTTTEDTDIETEADLRIGKIDATDPALAGTSVTYTLDVFNDGPSDATNVIVVDDVPAGLMFDFAGVTCTPGVPGPGQLTCDLGDISSGNAIFFDITFTIDSDTPAGTITNEATVSSDIFDPDTSNNTTTEDTDIETEADLSITKTDTSDPVLAGTSVTYTIDVFNDGPSDATNVIVVDDVPAGLMFDFSDPVACAPVAPGVLECDLGDMPAGFGGSFEVTFTIDSDTPAGTITNEATVSSDIFDPDTSDNTDTEDTDIETAADLVITKTDEADPVLAGTDVTYTIEVTNIGPSDATDVTVIDTLPAGVTYVSDTDSCVEAPAGTLTCDLGTILAFDVATFDVTVAVAPDTTGTITNTATVSSATPDPDTTDNEASEDTTIGVEADIAITKSADVTTAVPGEDDITYTIVVLNAGPASDPAVAVADTFPSSLDCTYTSTAAGGATGNTASGSGNLAETLSMPPDSSVTYIATCTIDPAATGTVTNTATAAGSAVDLVDTNDSASVAVELTPEVDIAVSIDTAAALVAGQSVLADALGAATLSAAGAATGGATPGSTVTYTIVVSNLGPSADPAVTLKDSFPAELTCAWTSTAAGGASGNTASASGNINETLSMPPGSSVTYTVNCTIDPDATGTISNTVTATASVTDRSAANNAAASSLKLSPMADISVTKDDGRTTAIPGFERLTYRIRVSNAGPSTDPKVALIDNFPNVLTCTWTSQAFGGASGNTASGSSSIGDQLAMPPGSSVSYVASCSIDRNARGLVSNTATATSSITDPDTSNNSATDTNTLKVPPGNLPGTGSSGSTTMTTLALATLFIGLLLVGLSRRSRRRKLIRTHG